MRNASLVALLATLLAIPLVTQAQRASAPAAPAATASGATARSVAAANAFIATLGEAEKAKTLFPFDSPQRQNWSNLPSGIYTRNSLRLGSVTPAQRDAAMKLMATVLSAEGYKKVNDIMNGDQVLMEQGGGRTGGRPAAPAGGAAPAPAAGNAPAPAAAPQGGGANGGGRAGGGGRGGGGRGGGGGVIFGLAEYYIAILGTPSVSTPWMVQFGGHHLAINVTLVGTANIMTPSLPAAQPASYTLNGQSIRPLGDEYDKGFVLINALNDAQKAEAILKYQVSDLVLGATSDGKTIQPEGILASKLTPAQQAILFDIAHEWVGILNDEGAAAKMTELKANLSRTYFAWSGPTTAGTLAYYRIQGPTVVIEYAPQQGDPQHVHTIYRDPTNDYGAALTKR